MDLINRRIAFLFTLFLLLLAIAATKAAWLGVVRADALRREATGQQQQTIVVPARRGSITDRHGRELAVSEPATTIAATPYLIRDPHGAAARLAPVLGVDQGTLLERLTRRHTGFVYVARRVPEEAARRARKLGIAGLDYIPEFKRAYPREWMAAQVLGGVGGEGQGLAGLEYRLDAALRGRDGRRSLTKDGIGDAIALRDTQPTRPGATVRLTLDANIQDVAEQALAEVGAQWRPKGATALVMDPRDGSILALANWPRVNAAEPASSAPPYARENRAVGATYEPGSTFKAFTVAGALEDRKVTPQTMLDLPPTLRIYDRVIKEAHDRGAVRWSVAEILAKSSNIGAVLIGQRVGADAFDGWVRRFGFGARTGVDLPGEEAGLVPRRSQYSGATMGNLPIGQGLAVTPLQMAAGYAAIANGGVLRQPHVVDSVDGRRAPRPRGRRVVSPHTAAQVRTMLEGVLGPGGTASGAAISGYHLAGKTGTAQKVDPRTGLYSTTKYIGSFVGFAPANDPQLLVTVMVDEPSGQIYGGLVAAPAFRKIVSFALNYLRIPPQ